MAKQNYWGLVKFRPVIRIILFILVAFFLTSCSSDQGGRSAPEPWDHPLRIAVFVGNGTCGDKIVALFRALSAAGFKPLGVLSDDINMGRLNRANFDVFVMPAGEDGSPQGYLDPQYLGNYETWKNIVTFAEEGGGVVGIEAGASFLSYIRIGGPVFIGTNPGPGLQNFSFLGSGFGSGAQAAYVSEGGGYYGQSGADTMAVDDLGRPAVVGYEYGGGRVVFCSFDPELRGDSELDWTIWDNWDMGEIHPDSEGCWILLARMINWACSGNASAPKISATNPTGSRVAVVSTHTINGGPSPSLLPAFARAIESAGHLPLAIRFQEIYDGRLTTQNFGVAAFPGGTVGGYSYGLSGYETAILDFVYQGGSYYGVCAGAYYASAYMVWNGSNYYVPLLGFFPGTDTGPLTEIAPWPNWALTPVQIGDPVIGDMGTQQQMYYGGGWKSPYPYVDVAATYVVPGPDNGAADAIRFTYGSGRIFLVGTHPEARSGSAEDWLFWDNWAPGATVPVVNPDNPWIFVNAVFNNWLIH
jgi:glutamine amidotransferase-like uncharacterized protein